MPQCLVKFRRFEDGERDEQKNVSCLYSSEQRFVHPPLDRIAIRHCVTRGLSHTDYLLFPRKQVLSAFVYAPWNVNDQVETWNQIRLGKTRQWRSNVRMSTKGRGLPADSAAIPAWTRYQWEGRHLQGTATLGLASPIQAIFRSASTFIGLTGSPPNLSAAPCNPSQPLRVSRVQDIKIIRPNNDLRSSRQHLMLLCLPQVAIKSNSYDW